MPASTLSRVELYQLLWSKPTVQIAGEFGLSDVGLAKLCRKHNVPRPPRGYWAKHKVGQAPPPIALPSPTEDYQITIGQFAAAFPRHVRANRATPGEPAEAKIVVSDSLRSPHQLIAEVREQLRDAESDECKLLKLPPSPAIDIRVSKPCVRRGLLILDALLKELEKKAQSVERGSVARVNGVAVHVRMEEVIETKQEEAPRSDFSGRYQFSHSRFNSRRVPTGRLAIQIDNTSFRYGSRGSQHTWRDTQKRPLEDRLNAVVAGIFEAAARIKQHEEERAREAEERRQAEQRRQEEARRRAEKIAQIKAEQERLNVLLTQLDDWKRSRDLRQFVEEVRSAHLQASGKLDPDIAAWAEWAESHAKRLDPLVKSPPSILDEEVELRDDRPRW